MNSRLNTLLDEQLFPYEGMSLEERNYYLNIIRNCKDICDTENKIGNIGKCNLIELHLKKENGVISFNGSLTVGTDKIQENRCIEGYLFLEKDCIIVDYKITRLGIEQMPNEYRVLDEFKLENDKLKRRSQYNYNMISIYDYVNDELMKRRLK